MAAWSGLGLVTAGLLAVALMPAPRQHVDAFLAFYAVAVAGYVLVWSGGDRLRLRWVLLVALFVRLAMFPGTPSLSDDYHRYVWDGRVQTAGFNPYDHPPASATLDGVAYDDRDRINFPDVRTIYPPLAEGLFLVVAAAHGGLLGLKLVFGLCDVALAVVLWRTVARERRAQALTLYLLCPLVVIETWHAAHVEIAAVLPVVVAAALVERRRDLAAGVALGIAAAVKLTPAFLLIPALVGGRTRARHFLPAFVLAFALPYVPYLLTGDVLGSLRDTEARPQFNASAFELLEHGVGYEVARVAVIALFVVVAVLVARRLPGRAKTTAAFAWTGTAVLLLMPIVHPWYWLGPVALAIAAGLRLPVYLGLAAPGSYLSFAPWWRWGRRVYLITYAPLAVAGVEWIVGRRAGRARPAAAKADTARRDSPGPS